MTRMLKVILSSEKYHRLENDLQKFYVHTRFDHRFIWEIEWKFDFCLPDT